MTDRPIPFSAPMVRAILREIEQPGTGKTQTRRILKPQPLPVGGAIYRPYPLTRPNEWHSVNAAGRIVNIQKIHAPGDRLWVREAWRTGRAYDDLSPSEMSGEEPIQYEAGPANQPRRHGRYRHARFMPRWASRITLIVEEVHVERLNDISEEDAIAEGAFRGKFSGRFADDYVTMAVAGRWFATARGWYADLWNRLHGPGSWEANPWVAVYGFRPVLANIDQMDIAHG